MPEALTNLNHIDLGRTQKGEKLGKLSILTLFSFILFVSVQLEVCMCDHSCNCVDEGASENNTVLNMIHQRMLNFHLGPQAQRTSYKSIVLHLRANMSRNISMSGLTLFLGKCLSTKLIRSLQHMVLGIKTNSLFMRI